MKIVIPDIYEVDRAVGNNLPDYRIELFPITYLSLQLGKLDKAIEL
jgi:hypothetical protein